MQYNYHPPVAERNEVNWYKNKHPGIYNTAPRAFFSSLVLSDEIIAWLDENAPGWKFRSDWDYSNAGDDDEGCHLTVPTREAGEAFVKMATAVSDAWIAADRERMPLRAYLVGPDGEQEVARAHKPYDLQYTLESELMRRIPLNDRRFGLFAARDAVEAMDAMKISGETSQTIALRLRPQEEVPSEAKRYHLRIEIQSHLEKAND